MSSFVSHLLSRHIETGNHVKPRLRARFEPVKTFSKPYIGDGNDILDTIKESDQIDLLQEQKGMNTMPDATQITVTGRAADTPSKFFKQNESIDNGFFKPLFFPNPLWKNNPALLHEQMKNISDQLTPYSIQPAGQQTLSAHKNREAEEGVQDQTFSKPHIGNSTVQQADGNHFGSKKTAPTISNPHAAENGTPVMHNLTTNGLSESRNDVLREARHSFQRSQNGKPSDHQVAETGPVIKVTIGRIDVRAVVQSAPAPVKQAPAATLKLSLDDYLKQRNRPST